MLFATTLAEYFGNMIIVGLLMVGVCRILFDKIDSKGEIKEAVKRKAVAKILDWFK